MNVQNTRLKTSVSELLLRERKRLSLSQPKMARLCGLGNSTTIANIETGPNIPNLETTIKIFRALNLDLNMLKEML